MAIDTDAAAVPLPRLRHLWRWRLQLAKSGTDTRAECSSQRDPSGIACAFYSIFREGWVGCLAKWRTHTRVRDAINRRSGAPHDGLRAAQPWSIRLLGTSFGSTLWKASDK